MGWLYGKSRKIYSQQKNKGKKLYNLFGFN